jgi:hypothetical protein
MKLIEPTISISIRDGVVEFTIYDGPSGTPFVELEMTDTNFMKALGRLAHVECQGEVRGLDRVGLYLELATLTFPLGESNLLGDDRKSLAAELATAAAPEGWKPDLYFGSQDSFRYHDGKTYGHTWLRRFVTEKPADERKHFGVIFEEPAKPTKRRRGAKA